MWRTLFTFVHTGERMPRWKRYKTLPERLQLAMAEKCLSRSELAQRSGLSVSYVHMLLRGERGARIGNRAARSLRAVLGVPDSFFDCVSTSEESHV